MSIHRRAAKRDENEPEIVKTLRAHGCVVWLLSGTGITDLLVMRNGRTWLADVKMPGKHPTKPQEDLWEEAATKAHVAVFILRTPADAVAMINSALQPWEQRALRGRAATGYTPPRQPPGDARLAEVFAPPPPNTSCGRAGCGHARSDHPAIFSGGKHPCAHCSCVSFLEAEVLALPQEPSPAKGPRRCSKGCGRHGWDTTYGTPWRCATCGQPAEAAS